MRAVILYHGGCVDGAMAAAVCLRALRGRGDGHGRDVECVPVSYETPVAEVLPKVAGADVYAVDFSFSPEETATIAGVARSVAVLDHHKTAVGRFAGADVPKNVSLCFDQSRSGAGIVWAHFCGGPLPWLVARVQDYDLWRHEFPESKGVHAYLRSLDMDVAAYVELLEVDVGEGGPTQTDKLRSVTGRARLLDRAEAVLRANQQQARALARKPEVVHFAGLTALAVNAPLHQDDVGEALALQCADGVGVCWYWRDGRYKVSLRSRSVDGREPFDCSALAAKFGGGGHVGAASFVCSVLPWGSWVESP